MIFEFQNEILKFTIEKPTKYVSLKNFFFSSKWFSILLVEIGLGEQQKKGKHDVKFWV